MKARFRLDSVTQIAGARRLKLNKAPMGASDDFTAMPITADVYNPNLPLKTGEIYILSIEAENQPAANATTATEKAAENTQQLTENNKNSNQTDMSIFTAIGAFFASIWTAIQKEWENLTPIVKSDAQAVLTFTGVLINYLGNSSSVVYQVLSGLIGTAAVTKIQGVLPTVATDLGVVITDLDQSNPEAVLQAILDDTAKLSGNALLDRIDAIEKYALQYLNPNELTRVTAGQMVQIAKTNISLPTIPTPPVPSATAAPAPQTNTSTAGDSASTASTGDTTASTAATGTSSTDAATTAASPQPTASAAPGSDSASNGVAAAPAQSN